MYKIEYTDEAKLHMQKLKHRLVYRIFDDTVLVLVLRAYGHYGDK